MTTAYCACLPLHLSRPALVSLCSLCQCEPRPRVPFLGAGPRAGENSLPVKQFLQNCSAVISREPKVFWGGCAGDLLHQGERRAACGGPQEAQGQHCEVDDSVWERICKIMLMAPLAFSTQRY